MLAATLFVTILLCLSFGIASGYLAVTLILHLMNYRPRPALAAHETQALAASGD